MKKKLLCSALVTCFALNLNAISVNAIEKSDELTKSDISDMVFYDIPIEDIKSGKVTSNNIENFKVTSNSDISTRELNQWRRSYKDFQFDKQSRADMEKKINSYAYSTLGTCITSLTGVGISGSLVGTWAGNLVADVANVGVDKFYSQFGKTVYGTTIAGVLGNKLRLGVYLYKDSARNNLVHSDTFSTDSYK